MDKYFMDIDSGEFSRPISDDMLMSFKGDFMVKMSDEVAMDIGTGDFHFITSVGPKEYNDINLDD